MQRRLNALLWLLLAASFQTEAFNLFSWKSGKPPGQRRRLQQNAVQSELTGTTAIVDTNPVPPRSRSSSGGIAAPFTSSGGIAGPFTSSKALGPSAKLVTTKSLSLPDSGQMVPPSARSLDPILQQVLQRMPSPEKRGDDIPKDPSPGEPSPTVALPGASSPPPSESQESPTPTPSSSSNSSDSSPTQSASPSSTSSQPAPGPTQGTTPTPDSNWTPPINPSQPSKSGISGSLFDGYFGTIIDASTPPYDILAVATFDQTGYNYTCFMCNITGDKRYSSGATFPVNIAVPIGTRVRVIFANNELDEGPLTEEGTPASFVNMEGEMSTDQIGGAAPILDPLHGIFDQANATDPMRGNVTRLYNFYEQARRVKLPSMTGSANGTYFEKAKLGNCTEQVARPNNASVKEDDDFASQISALLQNQSESGVSISSLQPSPGPNANPDIYTQIIDAVRNYLAGGEAEDSANTDQVPPGIWEADPSASTGTSGQVYEAIPQPIPGLNDPWPVQGQSQDTYAADPGQSSGGDQGGGSQNYGGDQGGGSQHYGGDQGGGYQAGQGDNSGGYNPDQNSGGQAQSYEQQGQGETQYADSQGGGGPVDAGGGEVQQASGSEEGEASPSDDSSQGEVAEGTEPSPVEGEQEGQAATEAQGDQAPAVPEASLEFTAVQETPQPVHPQAGGSTSQSMGLLHVEKKVVCDQNAFVVNGKPSCCYSKEKEPAAASPGYQLLTDQKALSCPAGSCIQRATLGTRVVDNEIELVYLGLQCRSPDGNISKEVEVASELDDDSVLKYDILPDGAACVSGFNGVPWNVVSGPDAELVPGPDGLWESAGDMHCEAGQYVGGLDLAVIDRGIRTICWSCQSLDTGPVQETSKTLSSLHARSNAPLPSLQKRLDRRSKAPQALPPELQSRLQQLVPPAMLPALESKLNKLANAPNISPALSSKLDKHVHKLSNQRKNDSKAESPVSHRDLQPSSIASTPKAATISSQPSSAPTLGINLPQTTPPPQRIQLAVSVPSSAPQQAVPRSTPAIVQSQAASSPLSALPKQNSKPAKLALSPLTVNVTPSVHPQADVPSEQPVKLDHPAETQPTAFQSSSPLPSQTDGPNLATSHLHKAQSTMPEQGSAQAPKKEAVVGIRFAGNATDQGHGNGTTDAKIQLVSQPPSYSAQRNNASGSGDVPLPTVTQIALQPSEAHLAHYVQAIKSEHADNPPPIATSPPQGASPPQTEQLTELPSQQATPPPIQTSTPPPTQLARPPGQSSGSPPSQPVVAEPPGEVLPHMSPAEPVQPTIDQPVQVATLKPTEAFPPEPTQTAVSQPTLSAGLQESATREAEAETLPKATETASAVETHIPEPIPINSVLPEISETEAAQTTTPEPINVDTPSPTEPATSLTQDAATSAPSETAAPEQAKAGISEPVENKTPVPELETKPLPQENLPTPVVASDVTEASKGEESVEASTESKGEA